MVRLTEACVRDWVRVLVAGIGLSGSIAAEAAGQSTTPARPRVTEDVVVTATLVPVRSDEVGRTVVSLSQDDFARLGLTSVVQALRLLPGVDVRARGAYDVQSDISIRGAGFGQSLVLYDGFRLNDAQSGHHNGEIPAPLLSVGRIEVAVGPGSAVHGADALGGTINVVPRLDAHAAVSMTLGQDGYAAAQASAAGGLLPERWTASAWAARSDGFTFDRDFAYGGAGLRAGVSPSLVADVRHQRRTFGANGFYGPSPSKEWTDQTMAAVAWQHHSGPWSWHSRLLYRNHGDHFRWDIARPGFAENRHRTDAAEATLLMQRPIARVGRLSGGGGLGGDWVDSSNLGDHRYARRFAFAELHTSLGRRTAINTGIRADHYSTFGAASTPALSIASWLSDALRVRVSIARAFRIPTFTERFYRDPAHAASATLSPEHGWAIDGGADWTGGGWTVSASPFLRRDSDVIDWVRATPTEMWHTTNVRDVATRGAELSAARRWARSSMKIGYSVLDVDAPALALLSKYVLEYARHAATLSVSAPAGAGASLVAHVDHRRRHGGAAYTLVGARVSRPFGRTDVFFEASNLLDVDYVEIPGVAMPGRWLAAGIVVR
jgi:iron complex outermembrane receptor protein